MRLRGGPGRGTPSALGYGTPATWRSGYAAACKAVYTGSIPVVASQSRRCQHAVFGNAGANTSDMVRIAAAEAEALVVSARTSGCDRPEEVACPCPPPQARFRQRSAHLRCSHAVQRRCRLRCERGFARQGEPARITSKARITSTARVAQTARIRTKRTAPTGGPGAWLAHCRTHARSRRG